MLNGIKKSAVSGAIVTMFALGLVGCGGGGGDDPAPGNNPPPVGQGPGPQDPGPNNPPPVQALSWAPTTGSTAEAQMWHWVAMNPTGNVMAAAAIPGTVHLSTDGGATWTQSTLPTAAWLSIDMTADGSRMVAVGFNGTMQMSVDGGANWARADTAFNTAPGGLQYESVTISHDGQRIAAVDLAGNVYRSVNGTDATPAFTTTSVAGAQFRGVDSSADGSVVVAVSQTGTAYLSTNDGEFTPLAISVGGAAVADSWYRVAVSDDGNTIVVAGNPSFGAGTSTGVYVSRDRGATWTQGSTVSGPYTSLDTSANGDVIVATMSGDAGQVLLSTNGGQSFEALTTPAGETNWRTVAMTSNASRLLLAAGTFLETAGQMYLSSGSVTGQ